MGLPPSPISSSKVHPLDESNVARSAGHDSNTVSRESSNNLAKTLGLRVNTSMENLREGLIQRDDDSAERTDGAALPPLESCAYSNTNEDLESLVGGGPVTADDLQGRLVLHGEVGRDGAAVERAARSALGISEAPGPAPPGSGRQSSHPGVQSDSPFDDAPQPPGGGIAKAGALHRAGSLDGAPASGTKGKGPAMARAPAAGSAPGTASGPVFGRIASQKAGKRLPGPKRIARRDSQRRLTSSGIMLASRSIRRPDPGQEGEGGVYAEKASGNFKAAVKRTRNMRKFLYVMRPSNLSFNKPRSILKYPSAPSRRASWKDLRARVSMTVARSSRSMGGRSSDYVPGQRKQKHVTFQLKPSRKEETVRVLGVFPLMHEGGRPIRIWRDFMVLPMAYETFAVAFRLAITSPGYNAQLLADVGVDGVFALDAFIRICTPYEDDLGYRVTEPARIFQNYFLRAFPRELLPCFLIYIPIALPGLGRGWWWALGLLRLVRTRMLWRYFQAMSLDLDINVRKLKVLQFVLLIFLTTHGVGCTFYFLARVNSFSHSTWVAQVEEEELVEGFSSEGASTTEKYALLMFRGINALTNIGYLWVMPDNAQEMAWSMAIMFLQVLVASYILGTLFHYLVSKDASLEDYMKKLEMLQDFMEERKLPQDLRRRLLHYFQFRFSKSRKNYGAQLQLPRALELRVVTMQYEGVIRRCQTGQGAALRGCNPQFLSLLLLRLREVFLMPGEVFISEGDITRDLFFVLKGVVDIRDSAGKVLRTVRGGEEGRTIVGEVGFFMGTLQPQTALARSTGDVEMLTLGKEQYNELIDSYPEQHEVIVGNILAEYGLDKKGMDLPGFSALPEEKDEVDKIRESIRSSMQRRAEDMFASLMYAVTMGDVEEVYTLLRKGIDINATTYDGKTVLHLAAMEGNYKVAEILLDEGADKNQVDRWGNTPLHTAVNAQQTQLVELLSQRGGILQVEDPAGALCDAASTGDLDQVRRLIDNGIDPNSGDYDQRTPLHLASAVGGQKVVEYLINKGADPNVKDRWGGTPLTDAVDQQHALVAHIIRGAGGVLPGGGADQLCDAATNGDVNALKMLQECGVDLDQGDYDGRTALHLAASEGRILVVSFMLSVSADPNVTDRWGGQPLDDALRGGHMYSAKLIACAGGECGESSSWPPEMMQELSEVRMSQVRNRVAFLRSKGLEKGGSKQTEAEERARWLALQESITTVAKVRRGMQELTIVLDGKSNVVHDLCDDMSKNLVALNLKGQRTQRLKLTPQYQQAYRAMEKKMAGSHTKRWQKAPSENIGPELEGVGAGSLSFSYSFDRRGEGGGSGSGTPKTPAEVDMQLYEELDQARALSKAVLYNKKSESEYKAAAKRLTRGKEREVGQAFQRIVVAQVEILQTGYDVLRSVFEPLEDEDRRVHEEELGHVLEMIGLYPTPKEVEAIVSEAWGMAALPETVAEAVKGEAQKARLEAQRRRAARRSSISLGASRESSFISIGAGAAGGDGAKRGLTHSVTLNGLWSSSPTFKGILETAVPSGTPALPQSELSRFEGLIETAASYLDSCADDPDEEEDEGWVPPDVLDAFLHLVARASAICDHCLMAFASDESDPTVDTNVINSVRATVSETGLLLYDQIFKEREMDEVLSPAGFYACFLNWLATASIEAQAEPDDDLPASSDPPAAIKSRVSRVFRGVRGPVPTSRLHRQLFDPRTLPRYEGAFVAATGGAHSPLRPHEMKTFLEHLFPRYHISGSHVMAVLATFDQNGIGQISLPEMIRVLKESGRDSALKEETREWHVGVVILPHIRFWKVWDMAMRLFGAYYFVSVPMQIAFDKLGDGEYFYVHVIDGVLDLLFFIDILLKFVRSYVNSSLIAVTSLKDIYLHYASTDLIPDAAAAFPLDLLAFSASRQLKAFLRMNKLIRVRMLLQHFREEQKNVNSNRGFASKLKPLLYLSCSALHVLACTYFFLGSRGKDRWHERMDGWYGGGGGAGVPQSYMLSLYYVTATVTTNGLVGDMLPRNYEEVLFAIVLQFVHMTMYAFVLGEISGLVMHNDNAIAEQRAQKATVDNFIAAKGGLSEDLRRDIRHHYSTVSKDVEASMEAVFSLMSHSLQVEVAKNISRALLTKVPLFSGCAESFLDHISVMLREVHVSPGDVIFHTNDPSSELFIIKSGMAEKLIEVPNEPPVPDGHVKPGGCIGEIGFFFGMRHVFTAKASNKDVLVMFVLKKESFTTLLKMHPEEESNIAANAIKGFDRAATNIKASTDGGSHATGAPESVADHFDNVVGGAVKQTIETLKRRRRTEAVERLLLAAGKGRIALLRSGVKTVSVNSCNTDSRSALHVAASEGQVEAVKILLEAGADVTITDKNGNTALNDAVRHKHEVVVDLLREAGAALKMDSFEAAVVICQAASENDLEVLRRYVGSGIDPSVADYDKRTALHLAASNGNIEAVRLLLSFGADIHARDRWNGSPLEDAVRHGHPEVQKELRAAGAVLSSGLHATRMCELAAEGNLQAIATYVENGVDPYDGRTALHLAACNKQLSAVELLLQLGDAQVARAQEQAAQALLALTAPPPALSAPPPLAPGLASASDLQTLEDNGGSAGRSRSRVGGMELSDDEDEGADAPGGGAAAIVPLPSPSSRRRAEEGGARGGAGGGAGAAPPDPAEMLRVFVNPVDRMGGTPFDDAVRHGNKVVQLLLSERGGMVGTGEGIEGVLQVQAKQRGRMLEDDALRIARSVMSRCREAQVQRDSAALLAQLTDLHDAMVTKGSSLSRQLGYLVERDETEGEGAAHSRLQANADELLELIEQAQLASTHEILSDRRLKWAARPVVERLSVLRPAVSYLHDIVSCVSFMMGNMKDATSAAGPSPAASPGRGSGGGGRPGGAAGAGEPEGGGSAGEGEGEGEGAAAPGGGWVPGLDGRAPERKDRRHSI